MNNHQSPDLSHLTRVPDFNTQDRKKKGGMQKFHSSTIGASTRLLFWSIRGGQSLRGPGFDVLSSSSLSSPSASNFFIFQPAQCRQFNSFSSSSSSSLAHFSSSSPTIFKRHSAVKLTPTRAYSTSNPTTTYSKLTAINLTLATAAVLSYYLYNSTMSAKLIPKDPEEVMVIRDVTPEITTLSVPFSRFGKFKIGGRATIGASIPAIPSRRSAAQQDSTDHPSLLQSNYNPALLQSSLPLP